MCSVLAIFILSLVAMLVTRQPAKAMMENARSGSPFNPSARQLLEY